MIHLITYADKNFHLASKLLMSEARALNIFDKIHCYTPNEIKDFLSDKWISKYPRGGGYWIWKPYIVSLELGKMNDGDILLYVDAGCQFIDSPKWDYYFDLLSQYDAIFMRFDRQVNYGFTPTVRCWTKKSAIRYFESSCEKKDWIDETQFITGCFFVKKTSNTVKFIKKWGHFMCQHQDLVTDTTDEERDEQDPLFCEHRHDQAILSLLLYTTKGQYNFLFYPEEIEWHYNLDDNKRAIIAARRKDSWARNNKKRVFRKIIKNELISLRNQLCK